MKRPTIEIDVSAGETDPHLKQVGEKARQATKKAIKATSPEIVYSIQQTFLAAITGKAVVRGETVRDLVDRCCPHIYAMAAEHGLVFTVDLPANTWENLRMARVFCEITPAPPRLVTRH